MVMVSGHGQIIVSRQYASQICSFTYYNGVQKYEKRKNCKNLVKGMPKKRTFAAKF
jgi:hypothetical protein